MDLGFTDEQEMLRKVARDFLARECPESLVRAMEDDELGYSGELWLKMAALGWQGLVIPEEHGGAGLGMLDLAVLLEEFGRALVPGPFISTVVHAGYALMLGGSPAQRSEYLPRIASGDLVACLAYTERSGRFSPEAVELTATVYGDTDTDAGTGTGTGTGGDGYVLTGTKLFVENATAADLMVVVARTGEAGTKEVRLSLFLVDPKATGITITPMETLASDKEAEVTFDNVRVPASALLGAEGSGRSVIDAVARRAAVAECAYLSGLAARDTYITVDYVKTRTQFGRPIGGFQALQHKAADMIVDVDGCKLMTYRAAWAIDEEEPDAAYWVSVAKGFASDASRRVVAHGQQMHGGIGFTREYRLQLYFLRQKAAEVKWGDSDFHRQLVADALGI
jgi:alkylation response protein AidB-like acyl-CoA dehydrogenase